MLPHHPQPCRSAVRAAAPLSAATRWHDQCSGLKRSPVQFEAETKAESKAVWWTSHATPSVRGALDDLEAQDTNVADLVTQLCTRIGMMMEDASPPALNASLERLEQRVADLAGAVKAIVAVADAAKALLNPCPFCDPLRKSRRDLPIREPAIRSGTERLLGRVSKSFSAGSLEHHLGCVKFSLGGHEF